MSNYLQARQIALFNPFFIFSRCKFAINHNRIFAGPGNFRQKEGLTRLIQSKYKFPIAKYLPNVQRLSNRNKYVVYYWTLHSGRDRTIFGLFKRFLLISKPVGILDSFIGKLPRQRQINPLFPQGTLTCSILYSVPEKCTLRPGSAQLVELGCSIGMI